MNCPNCKTKIDEKSVVPTFLWEPNWDFWGIKGQRWIVCRKENYIHFRVDLNGQEKHRLAQISRRV
jgi:hypothetical protein